MNRKRNKIRELIIKVFTKTRIVAENYLYSEKFIKKASLGMIEQNQWHEINLVSKNPIIKNMIHYCTNYKKDAKNISVYATQLKAIKFAYIEKKLKTRIIFDPKN